MYTGAGNGATEQVWQFWESELAERAPPARAATGNVRTAAATPRRVTISGGPRLTRAATSKPYPALGTFFRRGDDHGCFISALIAVLWHSERTTENIQTLTTLRCGAAAHTLGKAVIVSVIAAVAHVAQAGYHGGDTGNVMDRICSICAAVGIRLSNMKNQKIIAPPPTRRKKKYLYTAIYNQYFKKCRPRNKTFTLTA